MNADLAKPSYHNLYLHPTYNPIFRWSRVVCSLIISLISPVQNKPEEAKRYMVAACQSPYGERFSTVKQIYVLFLTVKQILCAM